MIGEAILHYVVKDQMGAGGMGEVYRALDTRLGRQVALKFLPEAARHDQGARARLLAEAQAAARLDHPNIGVIHAIEDAEDHPFIVMALYEGESLRGRIDRAPMAVHEAVEVAAQVARGLARAHEQSVVHRDVKPDNLFLAANGPVKILDFGLAKLDRMDALAGPGTLVGTLEYMSPEQIRGQAVDERTDLWALGVVLYEMLTGVSPFRTDGGMTASILRIIKDEPEPLPALRPESPPGLAVIVERALVKDRDGRYSSAVEMLADLEVALRGGVPSGAAASAISASTSVAASFAPGTGAAASPPTSPAASPAAAAPTRARIVVPTPSTPLVGRGDELAIIATNLDDPNCRVLTLFGPGGTGKTRLATEAAKQAVERGTFPDGVVFVPMDGFDDAELIPQAIARGLDVDLEPQRPALEQVQTAIGERSMLLVLDNYEHVMEGAQLPSDLVSVCPGLRILATSRERLNLDEEWVLPLPGLTLPEEGASSHDEIMRCEAVQLFVHRAKRASLHFSIEDEGSANVARICRLVAGSPLGIELAAAWVKMMSCEEIANEIQSSIDFLASSSRNVSERHRSLRACFEYSWTLLAPKERDAFGRLSTFQGSFTREAASAVAGAALPLLMALLDKSLLKVEGKRYEAHPLLHQYAAEKLGEDQAAKAEVEQKHCEHFLSAVEASLGKSDELTRIDGELPEILSAMQRAESRGDRSSLISFMRALAVDGNYYSARGHSARSLELVASAVGAAKEQDELMTAHLLLCNLANTRKLHLGDHESALEAYREALDLAEVLGDPHRQAIVLSAIGQTRFEQGEADGEEYLERAYALARENGDVLALNHVLQHQGHRAGSQGDWETAGRLYGEALEVLDGRGSGTTSGHAYQLFLTLLNLGEPERMLGRHERALELRRRALEMAEAHDNRLWRAYAVHEIGEVYHGMDERDAAQRHFDEALELWRQNNVKVMTESLRAFMESEGYRVPGA